MPTDGVPGTRESKLSSVTQVFGQSDWKDGVSNLPRWINLGKEEFNGDKIRSTI